MIDYVLVLVAATALSAAPPHSTHHASLEACQASAAAMTLPAGMRCVCLPVDRVALPMDATQ